MKEINALALTMDLDSNDTEAEQFIVAEENGKIAGFGRLWQHDDALELGTIGIVKEFRKKGLGKKIIENLLDNSKGTLYLTTLIPDFFKQFGFRPVADTPPNSMIRKAEWCEGCTKVGCTVMKLDR